MLDFQDINSVENYNYNSKIYSPCEINYHFHKNYELVYVMEGEILANVDTKEFVIKKGEFSLILPNNIHYLHTPSYAKVWIGVFSADFVSSFDEFMQGKANKNVVFKADKKKAAYKAAYIEELFTLNRFELFSMQSLLYAVCSEYVKNGNFYSAAKEYNDLPLKIFEYIKNNFKKDISLKSISAELGYDYHYMSRVYHSVFHTNFRSFLNQFRTDYALKLLNSTPLTITEIAMESGFGSVRTLNRSFMSAYGKPPGQILKSRAGSAADCADISFDKEGVKFESDN